MTIKPAPSLPFETFLAVQLPDRGSIELRTVYEGFSGLDVIQITTKIGGVPMG
jgi:hypothetical protein